MYIYLATRQKRLVLKIVTSFLVLHADCYITRNVFTVSTTEYGRQECVYVGLCTICGQYIYSNQELYSLTITDILK